MLCCQNEIRAARFGVRSQGGAAKSARPNPRRRRARAPGEGSPQGACCESGAASQRRAGGTPARRGGAPP
eukprot:scaffold1747_cov392-Prasinococcus_capsulatus_cf.AAC.8